MSFALDGAWISLLLNQAALLRLLFLTEYADMNIFYWQVLSFSLPPYTRGEK